MHETAIPHSYEQQQPQQDDDDLPMAELDDDENSMDDKAKDNSMEVDQNTVQNGSKSDNVGRKDDGDSSEAKKEDDAPLHDNPKIVKMYQMISEMSDADLVEWTEEGNAFMFNQQHEKLSMYVEMSFSLTKDCGIVFCMFVF